MLLPMGLGYVEGLRTMAFATARQRRLQRSMPLPAKSMLSKSASSASGIHRLFLNHIDRAVSANLEFYPIVDNYATYKHPKVKACLARRLATTCTSRRHT